MLRLHKFQQACARHLDSNSTMTSLFGQHSSLGTCLLGRRSRGPACLQATKRAVAYPGGKRPNSNTVVVDRPPPSQDLPEVSSVPRPTGVTDGPWDAQDVKAVEEALEQKRGGPSRRQVGQAGQCSFLINSPSNTRRTDFLTILSHKGGAELRPRTCFTSCNTAVLEAPHSMVMGPALSDMLVTSILVDQDVVPFLVGQDLF